MNRTTLKRGFTLVEILIVVIILGILAAIVIPQFTNASQDARKNSLSSQLQTIRSQVELYKMQHLDKLPANLYVASGTSSDWTQLTSKTNNAGTVGTGAGFDFGPYLQQTPANPLNGFTTATIVASDPTPGTTTVSGSNIGYVINPADGKIWATSSLGGYVYDEGNPANPNNDK